MKDTPNLKFQKTDFDSLLTQGQDMIRCLPEILARRSRLKA